MNIESREDAERLVNAINTVNSQISKAAMVEQIMGIYEVQDVRRCVPGLFGARTHYGVNGDWRCSICLSGYYGHIIPSETICKGPAEPHAEGEQEKCATCGRDWPCPAEPLETPPDVSQFEFEGFRVEVAESKKRRVCPYELYYTSSGVLQLQYPKGTQSEHWILRTIPWDNVYGCDPALVSLDGKLSPNGKKVQRVQGEWFRLPKDKELALFSDGKVCLTCFDWKQDGEDSQNRIIVEEIPEPVQEPKVRRFICESIHGGLGYSEPRELADPDDPKVLERLLSVGIEAYHAHNAACRVTTLEGCLAKVIRAIIPAYLEYNGGQK